MRQALIRSTRAVFLTILTLGTLGVAGLDAQSPPAMDDGEHVADGSSPDTLAAAVYEIVSGPAGANRDWERYRALFRKDARFMTFGEKDGELQVHDFGVEQYIEWYGPGFDERGVYEREINHRTERHGHLAHRFGTCEYRWGNPDGPPAPSAGRCLTSMQFVNDGERWWIVSMIWESETEDAPIPARYLPPGD